MHMYSTDARAMCIKAYIQMKSLRKTSTLTGVSKSTIQRWATANPIVLRSQKARKATTEAVQRIVQLVSSHPFDTPSKIATRIHDELKLHLSTSAVKFWMKRSGITYKKAARYVMTQDVEDKRKTYAQDSALYDPSRVISKVLLASEAAQKLRGGRQPDRLGAGTLRPLRPEGRGLPKAILPRPAGKVLGKALSLPSPDASPRGSGFPG